MLVWRLMMLTGTGDVVDELVLAYEFLDAEDELRRNEKRMLLKEV